MHLNLFVQPFALFVDGVVKFLQFADVVLKTANVCVRVVIKRNTKLAEVELLVFETPGSWGSDLIIDWMSEIFGPGDFFGIKIKTINDNILFWVFFHIFPKV